jgi:threonine dehydrogenase-like Zn-dependent dehydrogenase
VALDPLALAGERRDAADALLEATRGVGIAMAVEAAGAGRHTFPALERAMALGGKVVQVGVGAGPTPVTMIELQVRNVNVYGSMGSSGSGAFPAAIRLLATQRLQVSDLVTARYSLERVLEAVDRAGERRDGKVMVRA